tara:strand:+ start:33 stop:512 length:480 start_codon:yes stop_codon:yes gene_type:complete
MEYSNSNIINNIDMNIDLANLDEIEEHYGTIFYKVAHESIIYVFNGSFFRKEDNCNLFIKYIIKVVEYYNNGNELTIILDLKHVLKNTLNIDFILKFVKQIKKTYDNFTLLRKFYIINCQPSFKRIYLFIKPFLHSNTINKISVIKEEKTLNIEHYYDN